MPEEAKVLVNGSEKIVDVKKIQPGMMLLVRPGERIALDGIVADGVSAVNQSLVTGESVSDSKEDQRITSMRER